MRVIRTGILDENIIRLKILLSNPNRLHRYILLAKSTDYKEGSFHSTEASGAVVMIRHGRHVPTPVLVAILNISGGVTSSL